MGCNKRRRELTKLEELLNAVSKMTLILDVTSGTKSTDKEILDEVEGKYHSFAFVRIVLHDDHACVMILNFNTIRINCTQDTETLEGENT